MPVRDFPPPPPPETFPANGFRTSEGTAIVFAGVFALIILSGGLFWALHIAESKRDAFMAKCIEFQTWDRCHTLLQYNRQDLMEQRR